jgi:hypothetical protein
MWVVSQPELTKDIKRSYYFAWYYLSAGKETQKDGRRVILLQELTTDPEAKKQKWVNVPELL